MISKQKRPVRLSKRYGKGTIKARQKNTPHYNPLFTPEGKPVSKLTLTPASHGFVTLGLTGRRR